MHSEWSRAHTPGPKKIGADAPVVLAVSLHVDVRSTLEAVAAAQGLRLISARHLQAACSALASQRVAVVFADESMRPWDQEVLREHASRTEIGIVWVEAEIPHDLITDVIRMYVSSKGRTPHGRGAAYAL